jgi:hypothetical protein
MVMTGKFIPTKSNWLQNKLVNAERCLRRTGPCQVCLLATEKWKPMRGITCLGHAFTHSIKYVTCGLLLSGLNRAGNKAPTTFSLLLVVYYKTGHFRLLRQLGTSEVQYRNLERCVAWNFYRIIISHSLCVMVLIAARLTEKYTKIETFVLFIYKFTPSSI